MKKMKIMLAAAGLTLGLSAGAQAHSVAHQHHNCTGHWKAGGWVQWHPQGGHQSIAKVGTQNYFKHDKSHAPYCPYHHDHGHHH